MQRTPGSIPGLKSTRKRDRPVLHDRGLVRRIGRGTRLHNNVTPTRNVTSGPTTSCLPNVVIGAEPQDYSYRGSDTAVVIGDGNTFREGVTVNRGSEKEDGVTRIGDNNFLMGNCHVAYYCKLGNNILIANGSLLAGHVHIHDHASISGGVAVHQFVTIGSYSFISQPRIARRAAVHVGRGNSRPPALHQHRRAQANDFTAERVQFIAARIACSIDRKSVRSHAREILRTNDQISPDVETLLAFIEGQQVGKHGRGREVRRAA